MTTRIRVLAAAVAAVALTALGAPAAGAAKTPQVTCAAQPASNVFAAWKDKALYSLAPGGAFEAGAPGWTLTGGASLAADNQPLLGGAGRGSLQLVPGSTATSPTMCVALGYPAGRAFARSLGDKAKVGVQVLHLADDGSLLRAESVQQLDAKSSVWAPTDSFSLSDNHADKLGGRVQLRFTLVKGLAARVDDVFADPRLAK